MAVCLSCTFHAALRQQLRNDDRPADSHTVALLPRSSAQMLGGGPSASPAWDLDLARPLALPPAHTGPPFAAGLPVSAPNMDSAANVHGRRAGLQDPSGFLPHQQLAAAGWPTTGLAVRTC